MDTSKAGRPIGGAMVGKSSFAVRPVPMGRDRRDAVDKTSMTARFLHHR